MRVTVVGLRSDDYTFLAGVMHRHTQRQVICFGARAGEHRMASLTERAIDGSQQVFGVLQDAVLEIPGVSAQDVCLAADRVCNLRMSMADADDVVVSVQVIVAVPVKQQGALAAADLYRILVEEPVSGTQQTGAFLDHAARDGGQTFQVVRVEGVDHLAPQIDVTGRHQNFLVIGLNAPRLRTGQQACGGATDW
ncbi:hypothetical protein FQZ97_823830 [compost metagenome]